MERDGVVDAPEDGPARKADLQIVSEVEVSLLTVVPGAFRVVVSGQLSQHDIEAIGSERGDKWEWMGAGGYKAEIVRWLCVAGEGQGSHGRGSPVDFLFAERERVTGERDSSVEFDCPHVIERCFCRNRPYK